LRGSGFSVDVGGGEQEFFGEREFVFAPDGEGAEGGGFGAHSVLRPEAGEEDRLRECANGFEIVVEEDALAGEVIEDGVAGPVGEPGAVNDEGCGERMEGFSADHRD
jgi:hypothetical protein